MKRLLILIAMSACSVTEPPTTDESGQATSTNASHWMVGTWLCGSGSGYFEVLPFIAHNTVGIYTVTEDARGDVRGDYREISADDRPLVDFTDVWQIGSTPDVNGNLPIVYRMETDDGFSGSATGIVRSNKSTSLEGFLMFPDGTVQNWHESSSEFDTSTGPRLFSSYFFGTLSVKREYFGLSCSLTTTSRPLG